MSDGYEKHTGKVLLFDYTFLSQQYEDRRPICLSDRERAIILSQLEYGRWRKRWVKGAGEPLTEPQFNEARGWVDTLAARLAGDPECETAVECTDYPPYASMIDIQPANPFVDPEYVPDGWLQPPFWILTTDPVWEALGLQPGDMITDLGRFPGGGFPPAPIATGLARFRVTVLGGDELEIHLVGFPSAGYVWIQKNDNPLTLETYDLNVDILNIPPEIGEVTIWQWNVEGDPLIEQWVDVTFIPSLGDEVIPVRYGGGLRKITLCREVEDTALDVRQNPDLPCILEKREDGGEWEQFADILLCASPAGGLLDQVLGDVPEDYDPTDTIQEPRPLPGDIGDDALCYVSTNAAVIVKKTLDDIRNQFDTVSDVSGLILILLTVVAGLLGWFWLAAALGLAFAALGVSWTVFGEEMDDTERDRLKCILYENGYIDEVDDFPSFYVDEVLSDLADEPGYFSSSLGAAAVLIYMMGNAGLRRMGSLPTGAEVDCSECENEWCYEFDFTLGQQGWQGVSVTGWNGSAWTGGYQDAGSRDWAYIHIEFDPTFVTAVQMNYCKNAGGGGNNSTGYVALLGGDTVNISFPLGGNACPGVSDFAPNVTTDQIYVNVNSGDVAGAGVTITRVAMRGTGVCPFGEPNCE